MLNKSKACFCHQKSKVASSYISPLTMQMGMKKTPDSSTFHTMTTNIYGYEENSSDNLLYQIVENNEDGVTLIDPLQGTSDAEYSGLREPPW